VGQLLLIYLTTLLDSRIFTLKKHNFDNGS
jgi:hypothetical protein